MNCVACGHFNPEAAKMCNKCGALSGYPRSAVPTPDMDPQVRERLPND